MGREKHRYRGVESKCRGEECMCMGGGGGGWWADYAAMKERKSIMGGREGWE